MRSRVTLMSGNMFPMSENRRTNGWKEGIRIEEKVEAPPPFTGSKTGRKPGLDF